MSRFEEIVFPRRLHRLDYFVRILVAAAILWLLLNSASPSDPTLGGLPLVGICLGSFAKGAEDRRSRFAVMALRGGTNEILRGAIARGLGLR